MKSDLESSFHLKIKNKSNYLIGMVRMIGPLSSALFSSSNSGRCFKILWDHRFCDPLEIVSLSFDKHCLLNRVHQKSKPPLPLCPAYHRNAPEFRKMLKNMLNQITGDLFRLKIFDQEVAMGCNFKISNGKVGLVTSPWKDLSTTSFLIYLPFFKKNYQPWISHSNQCK